MKLDFYDIHFLGNSYRAIFMRNGGSFKYHGEALSGVRVHIRSTGASCDVWPTFKSVWRRPSSAALHRETNRRLEGAELSRPDARRVSRRAEWVGADTRTQTRSTSGTYGFGAGAVRDTRRNVRVRRRWELLTRERVRNGRRRALGHVSAILSVVGGGHSLINGRYQLDRGPRTDPSRYQGLYQNQNVGPRQPLILPLIPPDNTDTANW